MQDEGNKNLKSQAASENEGGNGKDKSKVEAKVWDIIAKIARASSKAEIDMLVGDALVLIANNGLPQNLIYNVLRTAEESKYIATGKDVGTFTNAWQANMAAIAAAELQAFYKEVKDLKSQEKAIIDKLSTESDFKALMEGTPEQAKQAAIALSQKNNEPPSVAFNGIIEFIKGLDQKIAVEKEELRKERERGEEAAGAIRLARIAAYEAQRESAMAGATAEMDRRRAVQVAIDKVGPIKEQSTPEQVQRFKNQVSGAMSYIQKDQATSRNLIEGVVAAATPGKPMDPALANRFDEDVKKIVAKDAESLKATEMAMFAAMAAVAPESSPPPHNQGAASKHEQSSQNIASGNEQAIPKPSAPPQAEVLGQKNGQPPIDKVPDGKPKPPPESSQQPEMASGEEARPKKAISKKGLKALGKLLEGNVVALPASKHIQGNEVGANQAIPVPSAPSQSDVLVNPVTPPQQSTQPQVISKPDKEVESPPPASGVNKTEPPAVSVEEAQPKKAMSKKGLKALGKLLGGNVEAQQLVAEAAKDALKDEKIQPPGGPVVQEPASAPGEEAQPKQSISRRGLKALGKLLAGNAAEPPLGSSDVALTSASQTSVKREDAPERRISNMPNEAIEAAKGMNNHFSQQSTAEEVSRKWAISTSKESKDSTIGRG